jgi:hypothetical protein
MKDGAATSDVERASTAGPGVRQSLKVHGDLLAGSRVVTAKPEFEALPDALPAARANREPAGRTNDPVRERHSSAG